PARGATDPPMARPVGPPPRQAATAVDPVRSRFTDWLSVRGCPSWPEATAASAEAGYMTASDFDHAYGFLLTRGRSPYMRRLWGVILVKCRRSAAGSIPTTQPRPDE